MLIAALYDIHGNLPALEATIEAVRRKGVDLIVIGGDVVPGPMPRESLDLLKRLPVPALFLSGNGEREVLAVRDGGTPNVPAQFFPMMQWVAHELTSADADWIRAWPTTVCLAVAGKSTTIFCHAAPGSDAALFTPTSSDAVLRHHFDRVAAGRIICGHIHVQYHHRFGRHTILNAGSVGMSPERGCADWLLIDDDDATFERTPFDPDAAAARVRATRYPMADEFARSTILQPPAADDVIASYTRAAEALARQRAT